MQRINRCIRTAFILMFLMSMLAVSPLSAQFVTTGNITTAAADCTLATTCVTATPSSASGTMGINVSGTFTGTLQFEGSIDGTNWQSLLASPIALGSTTTSTTAIGIWQADIPSISLVRVRASALSGGTAVITLKEGTRTNVQALSSDLKGLNVHGSTGGIHCVVPVSTATTLQAVSGSCIAPGAGLSIYITDIAFGTSAAAGVAADSFPTIKSGTGGTCGTATAVIWQALTTANSTLIENRSTPIKVAANSELCWIMTTAGSKTLQISGFIAP